MTQANISHEDESRNNNNTDSVSLPEDNDSTNHVTTNHEVQNHAGEDQNDEQHYPNSRQHTQSSSNSIDNNSQESDLLTSATSHVSRISGTMIPTLRSVPTGLNLASIHSLHPQGDLKLNSRFMLMPSNDQIRELQTVLRDKETTRGNFKFYADRLIRLVVEEGLNQLPTEVVEVETPTGHIFRGIRYLKGNCGVSIVRSGESMEQGLRDCCRSIRIGKILIESDESNQARVLYAKFPKDIAERKILLLYPIMSTGLAVIESVKVLLSHGVREENLILLNLFSSPRAAKMINGSFPKMFALTSDINPVCPNHFGQRYFGTD